MKPTKNRVYCRDCGRPKMLFETEKKAKTFIKFNSEIIEAETGYAPVRSYYCISCNGWHVTSKIENYTNKSFTEKILDQYGKVNEMKAKMKIRNKKIKQERKEKLNKCIY